MHNTVDHYLAHGCGRCPLASTPQCKVHPWASVLVVLRRLLLQCGLQETVKWGVPCYMWEGKNVALLGAFKNYCAIHFFKGALLRDEQALLSKPGAHTQVDRIIRITDPTEVVRLEGDIKACILEAIEIEKAGSQAIRVSNPDPVPAELEEKWETMPQLKTAFQALTPGRQRGYILHFSAPKQSKTRVARIEACIPRILQGKGLYDPADVV